MRGRQALWEFVRRSRIAVLGGEGFVQGVGGEVGAVGPADDAVPAQQGEPASTHGRMTSRLD